MTDSKTRDESCAPQGSDLEMLDKLQRETFDFFLDQQNAITGLIVDSTEPGAPSSIAAVGMGLASYVAGAERDFISKDEARNRILKTLRFFKTSHQGPETDATGYKGFYYHFLDMRTGRRAWKSELSTIDTAFLVIGALTAAQYFTGNDGPEVEIRELADQIYRRVDWVWALNGRSTLSQGWKPESGFLPGWWDSGYNESIFMYVLALGSPTFPIRPQGYSDWTATFERKKFYGIEYIYAGPLFIHQFSHMWIDFRGISDEVTAKMGIDYFENSRRATFIHQKYGIANPKKFAHYGANSWGLTASDGPGPKTVEVDGQARVFYDYLARGAPLGPDDGTIAPWAVVASLPFAPEIVIGTIRHAIEKQKVKNQRIYGFDACFNFAFPETGLHPFGWISPWRFGLNQGPIVLMIENYRSRLIWNLACKIPYVISGLKRAGFKKGWLEKS